MSDHVPHPSRFLRAPQWDDWLADRLASAFGSTVTVFVFLVIPLAALMFSIVVQNVVFFLASGWIQLWALPLLNYAQNKADRQRMAKMEADHQALLTIYDGLTHLSHSVEQLIDVGGDRYGTVRREAPK